MRRPAWPAVIALVAALLVGCATRPGPSAPQPTEPSARPSSSPTEPSLPTTLPGETRTPVLMQPWRSYAGLVVSGPAGGADTSGHLVSWSRPQEVVAPGLPSDTQLSHASGPYLAGTVQDIDATIPELVRIDMRDGTIVRRKEVVPGLGLLVGVDAGGWILDASMDSTDLEVRYVPLDADEDVWDIDWVESMPLAAGHAGIVTVADGVLELRSVDGATSYDLAEVPSGTSDIAVALNGDLVTWWLGEQGLLGYRDLRTGLIETVTVGSGIAYPQLAVVDGAVAVVQDQSVLWVWHPGEPFPQRPVTLGGGLDVGQFGAFPAARTDGRPAFAVDAYLGDERETWALVDAASGEMLTSSPGWQVPAYVDGVAASDELMVAIYDIGPWVELGHENTRYFATAIGYGLTGQGSLPELFRQDMAVGGRPAPIAVDAARSVVVVMPELKARSMRARYRTGAAVTGSAYLAGTSLSGISMSGPWTAVAGSSQGRDRTPSVVLGPGGAVVRTLPATTVDVAQDGPVTAYATLEGGVWTVDARAPRRAPVLVMQACEPGMCELSLDLDGDRLLVGVWASDGLGDALRVVTLGEPGAEVVVPVPAGAALSAELEGDLVVMIDEGEAQLLSVDLGAATPTAVARLAVAPWDVVALAGDRLVWCPVVPPGGVPCASLAVAPVPQHWGSTT